MQKSPRSIEVTITKASIGRTTNVSARRRSRTGSTRLTTNENEGETDKKGLNARERGRMKNVEKVITPGPPKTLMQAHQELVRIRPSHEASSAAWLAYYQRSVSVYEQIAETDPGHAGEARYWAQREQARAKNIAARIRTHGE